MSVSLRGYLLEICTKDYPTYAAGLSANKYGNADVIRYAITGSLPEVRYLEPGTQSALPDMARFGTITLTRLPNGFFAWIPSEKDDIAYVSEFRSSNRYVNLAPARYLTVDGSFHESRLQEEFKRDIAGFKRYLTTGLVAKFTEQYMEPDKAYRIAVHFKDRKDRFVPVVHVVATLIFCEEA